jgi:H2-forming N5,N10-methylenetetrahydromethanopterin dehydrogenase-like enzyme
MVRKELEKVASGQKATVAIKNDIISYVADEVVVDTQKIINGVKQYAEDDIVETLQYAEKQLREVAA